MIPKIIHYCWFGRNPLPDEYRVYMESWKKYCPDYEIKEWNEDSFDINQNQYCREAYESQKWAFVSDYARLKIVYDYGGVYLDTDVELLRSLTPLIESGIGFIGFQNQEQITTGLGFAAKPKNECIKKMLDLYENRSFITEKGKYDLTPCPVYNTVALKQYGLKVGKNNSKTIQEICEINILPIEYLNPYNADTSEMNITENTYTIHHYSASWFKKGQKKIQKIKKLIPNFILKLRVNWISIRDIKRVEKELKLREKNYEQN